MFKKLVTNLFDFSERLSDVKDARAFNRCATTTEAREWFGFKPRERFTFDDLQLICADWRRRHAGGSEEDYRYMARAYQLLAGEARGTTSEQMTEEDNQYRFEAHKLWKSVEPLFSKMSYDEACNLFASHCEISPDTVKDLFPVELTALFGDHQKRCLTVETARQFDEAYRLVFIKNYYRINNGHYAWETYIAQPYSPALEQQLAESVAPPVTEEEQLAPVVVAAPEEEIIEAPALSPEMSVEEALRAFAFQQDDEFDEEELNARYDDKSVLTDSKTEQVTIDTAYEVLKAYLKEQKKAAYQKERTLFGFGPTETFTEKDLNLRYRQASAKTDSKADQKILDEAYQVLLKIAA